MAENALIHSVTSALAGVVNPSTGRDVMGAGQVQDLEVGDDGEVKLAFLLGSGDPGSLVKAVRQAVESVPGVTGVKVGVQLPRTGAMKAGPGRVGAEAGPARPGAVPAPTPKPGVLPGNPRIVAVSSGKGGVGKSMVAANLAAAMARRGQSVGLLDADVYGPNIPTMFGETGRPRVTGSPGREMIEPLEVDGVRLMSIGFLLEREQPAIMRGPLISGILKQFLEQVDWGALDVMVVDLPPGTGDAQLSLVQTMDIHGAVMVTTPQDIATGDVRRGIKMFERVNTRVLGIVENMSRFTCPHCGESVDVFGSGGGQRLAAEMNVPFLGAIPLDPAVREAGDAGSPTVWSAPGSAAASALEEIAEKVLSTLGGERA